MGETLETRKGQNLETIISKLSKEQPAGKRDSYLLISGLDHTSLMFHVGSSGHEPSDEDEEPDIFQCGRCRQMYTNLQKYLRHKSSRECRQKSATPSTVTSPGFSESGNLEYYEENNFVQSPPKRKHDRKGIARRVSNIPESDPASDPPSPDMPVVLPEHRPFGIVSHSGPPGLTPVCSVLNGLPNPIAHTTNGSFVSRVPVLKSPTEQTSLQARPEVGQRPEVSQRGPSMASPHAYPLPYVTSQQSPVHHVIINNPLPPSHMIPGHGWPRPTIAVDPHFSVDKESPLNALHRATQVRADGKIQPPPQERTAPPPPPQQNVPLDSSGHPIVVHLKERGRPIRPKETGLTEEELTEEIITSTGQKIFKCKKCEKEFSFSSRLKRHLLVHTGARPFECPICYRRFTQAVDLKRHMLRHSGQKPHVCQYCGKQYTRGDRLKVHLLSHTDGSQNHTVVAKPYNCSRCNMSFAEAEQLYQHSCDMSQENEKPLAVELDKAGDDEGSNGADQGSLSPDSSGRTESRSKSYRCEECHSTFTKSTSLKSHLMKHTGEKKFKCEHCNKTFFSSSSLKIHVRVHTGDRPFKCKDCPRKFSDPSNFNKHKRWHAKQSAHGGFGGYTMHVMKAPVPGSAGDQEEESPPEKKPRTGSDSESVEGPSEHARRGSVDSSGEAEASTHTPEGSDSLFVEGDDEDEDISVDDDDGQVPSFVSPEALVGMGENTREEEKFSEDNSDEQHAEEDAKENGGEPEVKKEKEEES